MRTHWGYQDKKPDLKLEIKKDSRKLSILTL